MKHALKTAIVWGMALAVLSGTGACRRKAGIEGRFEYSAGWLSAELTRVVTEEQAPADGAGNVQPPVRVEVPKKLGGKRVRSVAPKAFQSCTNAVSVKLPPRVSRIGAEAFAGCTELVWAELPSHLERLEEGLFSNCRRMEESDIPERVAEIGPRAYSGCVNLRRVAVPESVRSVGKQAFAGCASLASVTLPEGLESIGAGVFAECRALKHVELPQGIANIPDGAFEGCSALRSVRIPPGVTNIGARAFAGCVMLEEIELPAGVAVLGEGVFADCIALARIGLPPGLESVGRDAFLNCRSLAELLLPETLRSVHPRAFASCSALVEVAEGNPVYCSRDGVLFGDGGAELLHFPVTRSGIYTVPEGVKRIGPDAFLASGVEGVRVPGSVESIGESAFRDCRNLQWVSLAEGMRELGDAAFMGCSSLWELVMPGSVERAGKDLVSGCDGLLTLAVPDNLVPEPPLDGAVPANCTICSLSEREAARQGKWLEDAHDPFYGLYTGEELDIVTFEGTVLAASAVPEPAENDYDDCLYAVLVELDSLLSSTPLGKNVERVVLVNVPIMKDRTIVRQNVFGPGSKISCTCASYDDMPQAVREIQLSDDIQTFEYQQYYPLGIKSVSAFQKTGNKDFAKREIAVLPVRSFPRDANAAAARRERIQGEIARIEGELARHGGSFEAWREEYKAVEEKYDRLCGEGHAAWTNDSYFAAKGWETTKSTYKTREYIEGLLPYKKYLEENNIDLIILRVPTKWDFAVRVLAADDFQENPAWVEHYYECLKQDIEIVDPMPEMWKERFSFPLFYFYNVPQENHPFEGESFVAAKVVSGILGRYQYPKSEAEIRLEDAEFETDDPRFFWPPGNGKFDSAENVSFKQVVRNNEPIGNLTDSSGSPFVFLSNSYFWYPQRPLGASVPGYAAYFLQAIPDWSYQDGSHNAMLRNLFARPSLLDSRKAIVMVGSPSDWKGIPPMPKYIRDRARRLTLEKGIDVFSEELAVVCDESSATLMEKDGALLYVEDETRDVQHLSIAFEVPHVAGKSTCMVRVNFARARAVGLDLVKAADESIVDSCNLAPSMGQSADLFLPLPQEDTEVKVFFFPQGHPKACFIKNIELWYY